MVTWVQIATASDLSPFADGNRVASPNTGTDTSYNVAPANGGGTETHGHITDADDPNNNAWESGTYTIEIEIDTGDAEINAQVRLVRLDAAGNVEETGAFTATQALDVSRTFTPAIPGGGWGSGGDPQACDDRFAIEILYTNNAAHGAHSVDVGLGTTANEIITPITRDTGPCAASLAPLIINKDCMI
ncbi:MAG: hypothetical protein ACXADH_01135 [Candidatus Kariarchaeaceae archaeon]|jgi:hypothetical protein